MPQQGQFTLADIDPVDGSTPPGAAHGQFRPDDVDPAPLVDRSTWGTRADGSPKGLGYFGLLTRPDGHVSSEISVGVTIDGREMDIPTMVPTLTADEVTTLLALDPERDRMPPEIVRKAAQYAVMRLKAGKSVWAQDGEQQADQYPEFLRAQVADPHLTVERPPAGWRPVAEGGPVQPDVPIQRSRTGQLYQTPPMGTNPILDAGYLGDQQIAKGAHELRDVLTDTTAPPPPTGPVRRSRTGALYQDPPPIDPRTLTGVADLAEGAMTKTMPFVAASGVVAPVRTAAALAAGKLAAVGTEKALTAAGASPEATRLVSDVAAAVAAGVPILDVLQNAVIETGKATRRAGDAAVAAREAAAAPTVIPPEPTDIPVRPEREQIPAYEPQFNPDPNAPPPPPAPAPPAIDTAAAVRDLATAEPGTPAAQTALAALHGAGWTPEQVQQALEQSRTAPAPQGQFRPEETTPVTSPAQPPAGTGSLESIGGAGTAIADNMWQRMYDRLQANKPVWDPTMGPPPLPEQIVQAAANRGLVQSIDDVKRFGRMSIEDARAFFSKPPDGQQVISDVPDLQGHTLLTGERVRDLLGVEPKDALARGWVELDESQGATGYRLIQNRPDLQSPPQGQFRPEDVEPVAEPGGRVDTLDTGEQQARLPGDAGAVRDQHVATPQLEAPFSLAGEPDTTSRGQQEGLAFGAGATDTTPDGTTRLEESQGAGTPGRPSVDRVAPSVPTRPETAKQQDARRAQHYGDVFTHVLAHAQEVDPTVDPAVVRAEFDHRVDQLEDIDREFRESGHNPRTLLDAIAKAGGISLDAEKGGGYSGELRWMRESAAGPHGNFAGVPNVFRRRTTDGRGKTVTGHGLDDMVRLLNQSPAFSHIHDIPDLVAALDDVARMGDVGGRGPTFPGTRELATRAGMTPGEPWWTDSWRQQPAETSDYDDDNLAADADGTFDPTQFDAAARGKAYGDMTEAELRELLDIGVGDEPSNAARELARRQEPQHTDTRPQPSADAPTVTINTARRSVEVKFPAKPSAEVRERLKGLGFRWAKTNGSWYTAAPGREQELADQVRELLGGTSPAPAGEPTRPTITLKDGETIELTARAASRQYSAGDKVRYANDPGPIYTVDRLPFAGDRLRINKPGSNTIEVDARQVTRVTEPKADEAQPRVVPVPPGWTLVVGRTRTKEGHTYEAEVDWKNKRIVFADMAHLENPEIRNHEIAHVIVEMLLPEADRQALLQAYVDELHLDAWEVKNHFHRERIIIDLTPYLTYGTAEPGLKAIFDQYVAPYIPGARAEPKGVKAKPAPATPAVATFTGGERVTADEGTGSVWAVSASGENVRILLDDTKRPSTWIPVSRVQPADETAPPAEDQGTPPAVSAPAVDVKAGIGTAPTELPEGQSSPAVRLFHVLRDNLDQIEKDPRDMRAFAGRILGGDPTTYLDDITDAIEAALTYNAPKFGQGRRLPGLITAARELEAKLPRAPRTLEKLDLQQFSTPLPIAVAAQYAANVQSGDRILEPTAGTGHLVSALDPTRYNVLVRELSARRAALLTALGYHTTEGDYLAMTEKAEADVIITNPPWGKYSKGKYGAPIGLGFTPRDVAERFVGKNLRDLKAGGRLVAVMPTTMLASPSFRHFLNQQGAVRAIIQSPPEAYRTRSTDVDSLLLVVDKGAPDTQATPLDALMAHGSHAPQTWEEYAEVVARIPVRAHTEGPRAEGDRPAEPPAGRPPATPAGPAPGTGGRRPAGPGSGSAGTGHDAVGGVADVPPGRVPDVVAAEPGSERGELEPRGAAPRPAREDARDATRGLSGDALDAYRDAAASTHFAPYRLRTDLAGVRHPKLVVEARALSGVPYPELTLEPTPRTTAIVKAGRVSIEQAEQALAAVQANIVGHHGYLAADNVGVGKSREIALTILELMDRATADGRPLRLMVTTYNRDTVAGLIDAELKKEVLAGADPGFEIVTVSEFKDAKKAVGQGYQPLPRHPHAIYVIDSFNLREYRQGLLDVELHGIIGDEVHNFKNADAGVGATWQTLHAQIMMRVPRAQQAFAYFTATPAQSVHDYKYLYGLREWPIDGFADWVLVVTGHATEKDADKLKADTEKGAINPDGLLANTATTVVGGDAEDVAHTASRFRSGNADDIFAQALSPSEAEQIPREWKVKGKFSSRDLWRAGTEFAVETRPLKDVHRRRYDRFAQLARDIIDAHRQFGALDKSGSRSRFGPTSALQNAAKRLQMQPAIEEAIAIAQTHLAEGYQAILSLINVSDMDPQAGNIAAAINQINTREVEKTEDGELIDHGEIPEALIRRGELLDQAKELGVLDNPLELVSQAFGDDQVAFVIGGAGKTRTTQVREFQEGTRRVAVISAAGTTGINLDHRVRTKQGPAHGRRVFIDVQYEWSATKAVQRYGRVDRSGQITPPKIIALNFGSASEKKFLATVANRMASLGALSKGGSESTGANALEEFEITGSDALLAARTVWDALPTAAKEDWKGNVFRDPGNREFPAVNTTADMRQIQLALLWLPLADSGAFWEAFIAERQRVREAMGYLDERRARRYTGEILRRKVLDETRTLYQVRNDNGERFGILSGIVMPEMPKLRTLIKDADGRVTRRYVTFTTGDGTIVAGLEIPWMRVPSVARLYGAILGGEHLNTPAKVRDALKVGEEVPLDHEPWVLRQRKDGKIAIDGAKMADRELLLKYGSGYMAAGNFWFVTNLETFLDRYPAKKPAVTVNARDEDPDAPDEPSPSRGGGRVQSAVLPGAAEFFEQDVAPSLRAAAEQLGQARADLRVLLAPDTVSGPAELFATTMRPNLAAHAQRVQRAQQLLATAEQAFDRRSHDANLAFIDAIETGAIDTLPPTLRDAAAALRDILDRKRREVQKRGKLDQYIRNYFPHEWAEPSGVQQALRRLFGRRPLQGSKAFLKQRSIPTVREGIEHGLVPISYNPVTLVLRKLVEMDKWIMAEDIKREGKQLGLVKFVAVGTDAPDGWTRFPDSFGTVYGPPVVHVKEAFDPDVMHGLERLADLLGVPHARRANLGGSRWGYYSDLEGVVTKFAGPEGVLMHEIGHAIDERFGLRQTWVHDPTMKQELRDLADLRFEGEERSDISASKFRYYRKGEEKIANLIHAFIYAPERAKKLAPNTFKALTTLARRTPELRPLLELQKTRSLKLDVNEVAIPVGGAVIHGYYYGPPDVVRILSNYLSPGLRGKSALFDTYRIAGNFLNQVQLGLSAFHVMLTGMESVVAKQATALELLSRGRFREAALKQLEVGPQSVVLDLLRGSRALKAFYGADANAAAITGVIGQVVSGGGGFGWTLNEHTGSIAAFAKALRQGNYPGAAFRALPALIEATVWPIMEWWVPRLKMAAYLDMARLELPELGPNPSIVEVRRVLAGAWDSVDNRFGQLRYDNLFWHNALKDLGMASVRALGWNVGTIREMFGAPTAQLRSLGVLAGAGGGGGGKRPTRLVNTGEDDEGHPKYEARPEPLLHRKMAWFVSMIFIYGLAGAIYQYLHTGKRPEELKDYFFPRTGRTNADGTAERMSLAGYFKDLYAVMHDLPGSAIQTAGHKLQPLLTLIADLLLNEDFYGTEIRNAKDPWVEQLNELVRYLGNEYQPFTIKNAREGRGSGVENFFGITPAPASVNRTDAESVLHDALARRGHGTTTREQADRRELRRDIRTGVAAGTAEGHAQAQAARATGELTAREVKQAIKDSGRSYLQRGFQTLTIDEALDVYQAATPEERQTLFWPLRKKAENAIAKGGSVPPNERGRVLKRLATATALPRAKKAG